MIRMSSVWDRATEFVGDNLRPILPFALVVMVAAAVQDIANQQLLTAAPLARLGGSGVLLIVSLVATVMRLAILALAIDDRRSPGEAFALVAGRLLAVLGLFALIGIVLTLAVLPVAAMLIAGGVTIQQLAQFDAQTIAQTMAAFPPGLALAIVGYALALGVAACWLGARLALLMPVVLAERQSVGAFARSFALTSGYALRILGVLILIGIVGFVGGLAAKTVFGSVLALALGRDGPLGVASILTALIVAAVMALVAVIGEAFTGKLYLAARAAEAEANAEAAGA